MCLVQPVDVPASEIALIFAVAFALKAFPLELNHPPKQDECSVGTIPLTKRVGDPIVQPAETVTENQLEDDGRNCHQINPSYPLGVVVIIGGIVGILIKSALAACLSQRHS